MKSLKMGTIVLSVFGLLLVFQNCADGGLESSSSNRELNSQTNENDTGNEDETPIKPKPPEPEPPILPTKNMVEFINSSNYSFARGDDVQILFKFKNPLPADAILKIIISADENGGSTAREIVRNLGMNGNSEMIEEELKKGDQEHLLLLEGKENVPLSASGILNIAATIESVPGAAQGDEIAGFQNSKVTLHPKNGDIVEVQRVFNVKVGATEFEYAMKTYAGVWKKVKLDPNGTSIAQSPNFDNSLSLLSTNGPFHASVNKSSGNMHALLDFRLVTQMGTDQSIQSIYGGRYSGIALLAGGTKFLPFLTTDSDPTARTAFNSSRKIFDSTVGKIVKIAPDTHSTPNIKFWTLNSEGKVSLFRININNGNLVNEGTYAFPVKAVDVVGYAGFAAIKLENNQIYLAQSLDFTKTERLNYLFSGSHLTLKGSMSVMILEYVPMAAAQVKFARAAQPFSVNVTTLRAAPLPTNGGTMDLVVDSNAAGYFFDPLSMTLNKD